MNTPDSDLMKALKANQTPIHEWVNRNNHLLTAGLEDVIVTITYNNDLAYDGVAVLTQLRQHIDDLARAVPNQIRTENEAYILLNHIDAVNQDIVEARRVVQEAVEHAMVYDGGFSPYMGKALDKFNAGLTPWEAATQTPDLQLHLQKLAQVDSPYVIGNEAPPEVERTHVSRLTPVVENKPIESGRDPVLVIAELKAKFNSWADKWCAYDGSKLGDIQFNIANGLVDDDPTRASFRISEEKLDNAIKRLKMDFLFRKPIDEWDMSAILKDLNLVTTELEEHQKYCVTIMEKNANRLGCQSAEDIELYDAMQAVITDWNANVMKNPAEIERAMGHFDIKPDAVIYSSR